MAKYKNTGDDDDDDVNDDDGVWTKDLIAQFEEHVAAFENAEPADLFEMLEKSGISMSPPGEMQDQELSDKLWGVIHQLALLRVYLESTDHLSDRELYTELWGDLLRQSMVIFPDDPTYACHLDIIGSGSEEDIQTYLRYYADEEYRRRWAADWPKDKIPNREKPKFDRDRHLPKPDMKIPDQIM